jgi:hypothetical protein
MTAAGFIEQMAPAAVACGRAVGWWPSVVLAQWCDETGFGTSWQWIHGNNPAGISPGGQLADYPTIEAGCGAWVSTALAHYYDGVRAAYPEGADAQAVALGASPWAAAHYDGAWWAGQVPTLRPGIDLLSIIRANGLTRYDDPAPAPPVKPPVPVPALDLGGDMLGTNDPDAGKVRAFIRWVWLIVRTDQMTALDQNLGVLAYYAPVADKGFGGSPDLLLAWIIDTAHTAGTTRFPNAA